MKHEIQLFISLKFYSTQRAQPRSFLSVLFMATFMLPWWTSCEGVLMTSESLKYYLLGTSQKKSAKAKKESKPPSTS